MRYVALLRGINIGGNRKVEMKRLKTLFESLGYENVSTYINSGNALFESSKRQNEVEQTIQKNLEKEFGFEIPSLVKTENEMKTISDAIPKTWKNNAEQKSDVAYLFKKIDTKEIVNELPMKKEFINIRYVKGAIIWNVKKSEYNKSNLSKITGHKAYRYMTLRNVNTARYLARLV